MHGFRMGLRAARGGLALILVVGVLSIFAARPLLAQGAEGRASHAGMDNMSDADMARWVHDFYRARPTSSGLKTQSAPVDTFFASGFTFNGDHNAATPVDTVHIFSGQTVMWRALDGSHTVTYGTGSTDPDVGTEFDTPINSLTSPDFTHLFPIAGTYPFFCRPHESFGMKGVVVVTDPSAADTFVANASAFDHDGNLATQVDTVFITTGQSVLWKLGVGAHTVTSGTGSTDPNVGALFDVDLDSGNQVFLYQFNQAGTVPFFCFIHEGLNMRGVVVVTDPVSALPGPVGRQIGFASEPEPNPTTGRVSFRLAMPLAGHASVGVFDARGQLVAEPVNRDLQAGTFTVTWNGTRTDGGRAATGVYYVRVTLPGYHDSRSVILTH